MSEFNLQPLGSRVVIKPLEQETRTASGLYIPESAKEKPQTGEVIAIGEDEDIKVNVGDKILYAKYSGTEFKLDGQDYLLMDYGDILAKFTS